MEPSTVEDGITEDFKRAKSFFQKRDYIKALETTEDSISVNGKSKNSAMLRWLQGTIFSTLAKETENNNAKSAFLLSAADSFCRSDCLIPGSLVLICSYAKSLFSLGQHLSLKLYYELAVSKAKEGLSLEDPKEMPECSEDLPSGTGGNLNCQERMDKFKKDLEALIKLSEARMNPHAAKTAVDSTIIINENNSRSRLASGLQERSKMRKSETQNAVAERLKSFWAGLGVESKRDFMKVGIKKLKCYAGEVYGREAKEALDRGLAFAKTSRKWKLWNCRACAQEFHRSAECKKHLEQEHAAKFRTSAKDVVPQQVDEIWGKMISSGDWEPVDTEAAVEMIKNQLVHVKELAYVNGWSKDWPLTNDDNRRAVLKRIHQALKSVLEQNALSCSIRDWIMNDTVKQLGIIGVPRNLLDDCGLVNTPQCICFLELRQLEKIQQYLRGTGPEIAKDLLSKAVDSYWECSRIKEKINFDNEYSCLLLDRRLLRGKAGAFDDEGTIDICNSDDHCARVSPQGDEIISWLLDCPLIDEEDMFQRPIRLCNLDIWLAILRLLETRARRVHREYKTKVEFLNYNASLLEAEGVCTSEDERRRKIPKSEWKTYACALCDRCEERVRKDARGSDATAIFLSAVRDLVEGSTVPRFGVSEWEVHLNQISELSDVSDDSIRRSLERLKTMVAWKIPMSDSQILSIENSRNQLLNDLTKLSMFDYRSYILPLLKWFLREELDKMVETDAKARSAAAEAALLAEIEQKETKKSLLPKKKREHKKIKETLTAGSGLPDHNAGLKPSVMRETKLMKTKEEDCVEPEVNIREDACPGDELSNEIGQLNGTVASVSSNTDNHNENEVHLEQQQFTSEEMQTMPGSSAMENSGTSNLKNDFDMEANPRGTSAEDKGTSSLKNDFQPSKADSFTLLGSAPIEDAAGRDSALDTILQALWHIKIFRDELGLCLAPAHVHVEDSCAVCVLQDLFYAFSSGQTDPQDGLYPYLLNSLQAVLKDTHPQANDAAALLMAIFEFLHSWKTRYKESIVNSIFLLEEFERMVCYSCRREPNYPEQWSYGVTISANSLRQIKFVLDGVKFEKLLKLILMNHQMICDPKSGGCGKQNYIRHVLSRCPSIFVVALEWGNNETEEEISATVTALATKIDISVLYEVELSRAKYRLVLMVGRAEKEHYCISNENENDEWTRHNASTAEGIGDWENVVGFCKERKVRPEILFFQSKVTGSKEELQTLSTRAPLENKEISEQENDVQPHKVVSSARRVSAPTEAATRNDSVLSMILKSFWNIRVLRQEFASCPWLVHNHQEGRSVLSQIRCLSSAFFLLYHYLLKDLHVALKATPPMGNGATELLIAIFEFLSSWKNPHGERPVTSLFVIEESERMSCKRRREKPDDPMQSSYGLLIGAKSLREIKSMSGDVKFWDILKVIQVNLLMLCDRGKGGCQERNKVYRVLTRFPAIFTIALKWENNETEEDILSTTMALATEIDISVLYEGFNQMTKHRLVSMVGCGGEVYNCIAYEKDRWVRHVSSTKAEEIGNWEDVVRLCGERKIRLEILFFEAI